MVLPLDRWIGKVAVVTGASAGIGASIAEHLVDHGIIVAGFARRSEKIEEIAKKLHNKKGKLNAVQCDISKESDIIKAFQWVRQNLGPVHILINNAGLNLPTNLKDGDAQKWRQVLDTNVLGLCICTREAVKQMEIAKIDGQVIQINSVLGHKVPPIPGLSIYPATKHAVTALTETLRHEFNHEKSKIKVTSLSPGVVKSEFQDVAGMNTDKHKAFFSTFTPLNPEDVANAVLYILSTPPHVLIAELTVMPVGEPV